MEKSIVLKQVKIQKVGESGGNQPERSVVSKTQKEVPQAAKQVIDQALKKIEVGATPAQDQAISKEQQASQKSKREVPKPREPKEY